MGVGTHLKGCGKHLKGTFKGGSNLSGETHLKGVGTHIKKVCGKTFDGGGAIPEGGGKTFKKGWANT